jgi:hypothetical protein
MSTPFGALTLYLFWPKSPPCCQAGERYRLDDTGVAATYVAGRRVMQSD